MKHIKQSNHQIEYVLYVPLSKVGLPYIPKVTVVSPIIWVEVPIMRNPPIDGQCQKAIYIYDALTMAHIML